MTSKQATARALQGWQKKPDTCAKCVNFSSTVAQEPTWGDPSSTWTKETNMRCDLGGFKTGKSNVCRHYALKVTP